MTRTKSITMAVGLFLTVLLGSAATAHAQYGYAPPPGGGGYYGPARTVRSGFEVGVGLGLGSISADNCANCGMALGLHLQLGAMVNPNLALELDIAGLGRTIEGTDDTLTQTAVMAAARFWVTDIVWIKGGLGVGRISYEYLGIDGYYWEYTDSALALMGAVGVDLLRSGPFVLDLQGRMTNVAYGDGSAQNWYLGVGFNWY